MRKKCAGGLGRKCPTGATVSRAAKRCPACAAGERTRKRVWMESYSLVELLDRVDVQLSIDAVAERTAAERTEAATWAGAEYYRSFVGGPAIERPAWLSA